MRRPDDYQSSRRALAAEYRGSPRTVPLSLGPSRGGHFHVCLRVVHVVDVVQRACECVYGVSTSYGCMWNRWYHVRNRPQGSGSARDGSERYMYMYPIHVGGERG